MGILNLIIGLCALFFVAASYFNAARRTGKNAYIWGLFGAILYFVISSVLVGLAFFLAGPPPDNPGNRVLLLILSAGLPLAVAMILRLVLLPVPHGAAAPDNTQTATNVDTGPDDGPPRILIYLPVLISTLWLLNQGFLGVLRSFVRHNFGPFQSIGHYMHVMGQIYDVMDTVAIGAWAVLLVYLGFRYFRRRAAGQGDSNVKLLLIALTCLLVQTFIVLA